MTGISNGVDWNIIILGNTFGNILFHSFPSVFSLHYINGQEFSEAVLESLDPVLKMRAESYE
jgi:uncharacterized protein YlbG (UPF0298 family)